MLTQMGNSSRHSKTLPTRISQADRRSTKDKEAITQTKHQHPKRRTRQWTTCHKREFLRFPALDRMIWTSHSICSLRFCGQLLPPLRLQLQLESAIVS